MEITSWGMSSSSCLLHPARREIGIFSDAFCNPSHCACMRHVQFPLPPVVKMHMAPGCVVYQAGPATHLIDEYGLGDALIARLPSTQSNPRIGHVARTIPDGYEESLKNGENQIVDPQIHEFYNHLKIVISGDLFSTERLREIYRFNVGQYSDLLRPQ